MATSKLTLYMQSGMKPENNYIVEDIREYLRLNAENTLVKEGFQYIRDPAKSQQFKVDIAQSAYNQAVFDYASLEQDGDTYYYFIVDATWKSQNCLGFTAVLDTLNTFQDQYRFTDRSNIERQHVDRFKLIGARPTGDSIDEVVTNVISDTREELQPELLMTRKEVLSGDLPIDNRYQWYLIYQTNTQSGNPQILLCADKDIDVGTESGPNEYIVTAADLVGQTPARMVFGKFKAIMNTDESETIEMNGSLSISVDPDSPDNMRYTYMPYFGLGYITDRRTGRIKIQLDGTTELKVYSVNQPNFNQPFVEATASYTLVGRAVMTSIDTIDRTLSNLYKVIECPYCPLDLQITNNVLTGIPEGWKYDQSQNKLSCDNLKYEFPERTAWTEENVMNHIAGQVIKAQRAKLTLYSRHDHSDGVEGNVVDPKTFISTLRSYNFVYDTASWSVIPEDLVIPNKTPRPDLVQVKFKQSNNISSDCGFRFDIPEFGKLHREYFDDYMFSMRSNELPLYSSDYINYMRNGYNYDLKANRLQMWSDIVGIGGQVLGAAGGIGSGIASNKLEKRRINAGYKEQKDLLDRWYGDKAYGLTNVDWALEGEYNQRLNSLQSARARSLNRVGGVSSFVIPSIVSNAVGVVVGTANAAISHFQRENALEQKINEYKNRAFSVSTTGNHDLFKWYSGNKLILFEFEPREEVRELINDYFSLYGYSRGYYEKPDLDSRLFFNYCRGYVDIDNYKKRRAIEENKADIVQKFQDGVYKIHKVNTPLGMYWDMKLERQNYERSILPLEWCK